MSIFREVARIYNQYLMPLIGGIRGTTYLSHKLSDLALRDVEVEDYFEVNNIKVSKSSFRLDRNAQRSLVAGTYEKAEHDMMEKHLPEDYDVIELGGGMGYIACLIDSVLQNKSKHIVLEPSAKLKPIIESNRKINGADFNLVNKAYSSSESALELNEGSSFLNSSTREAHSANTGKVEGLSLEQITREYSIDNFVLVADIEGSEYEMLNKELGLISDRCVLAIIEFHDFDGESVEEGIQMMKDNGFEKIDENSGVVVFSKA